MRHFLKPTFAIILLAMTLASAFAQGVRTSSGKLYPLFTRDDVKNDLKLTADQRKRIDGIIDKLEGKHGIENVGGARRSHNGSNWMDLIEEDIRKEVFPLLTKTQLVRVEQLRIQLGGNRSLAEKKIQDQLKFTQAQRDRVSKLIAASEEEAQDIVQGAGGRIDQQTMNELKALTTRLNDDLGKVLTSEQREAFAKMKGSKLGS